MVWPRVAYASHLASYPGSVICINSGNSFRSKTRAGPSLAITGSKSRAIKASIIGMQRVACPKPQFRGATNIRFFKTMKNKDKAKMFA